MASEKQLKRVLASVYRSEKSRSVKIPSEDEIISLPLTKDGLMLRYPAEPGESVLNSEYLHLDDILDVPAIHGNRVMLPGCYVIIGGPSSGKTELLRSISKQITSVRPNWSNAFCRIMEPAPQDELEKGWFPLYQTEHIQFGLNAAFFGNSQVVFIDSLRFLNAESRYPARAGGVSAGLEMYTTVLHSACERTGKYGFMVFSTGSSDSKVTETLAALIQGSTQGILVPKPITASMIGTKEGQGVISMRGGDRSFIGYSFHTEESNYNLSIQGTVVGDEVDTSGESSKEDVVSAGVVGAVANQALNILNN